jgi:hypothetical protein
MNEFFLSIPLLKGHILLHPNYKVKWDVLIFFGLIFGFGFILFRRITLFSFLKIISPYSLQCPTTLTFPSSERTVIPVHKANT